ncbi:asparaginase domain-containing protein [Hellea balneolensis]|uniref:asparaginase domain-containing protein n=1 Tax=Hellea balneolensis TaxID=287478 RepID=UPI0003FE8493|nr:asparaginase domain-containing protein [Hellea balneolensis]
MDILILITGGTLDKVHDTVTESLVFGGGGKSRVSNILKTGRTDHPRLKVLMQKDSLDMTDEDRALILQAVLDAPQDRIILTHGTGTMELTAKYLDGKVGDKTLVLTGAMRPQSLGKSDAGFNLGGAIIAAQTLGKGVYAVMNGRVFKANDVRKDTKLGRFDI